MIDKNFRYHRFHATQDKPNGKFLQVTIGVKYFQIHKKSMICIIIIDDREKKGIKTVIKSKNNSIFTGNGGNGNNLNY